jgi:hypothetical protein
MSQLAMIDMTPEETAVLQQEATRLARLLSASEKFTAEAANPPVPGSRMGHAHTADLRDAYGIAQLLILACKDHLRTALLVFITGPLPSFALYTLLRAAGDAVVRAKHLLDPAISEQTRLARGMNERLDNINQLFKVMAAPRPGTLRPACTAPRTASPRERDIGVAREAEGRHGWQGHRLR